MGPFRGKEPEKQADPRSSCEPSGPIQSDALRSEREGSPTALVEASALANAARELLRAGLGDQARPIVERLAVVLEGMSGPKADVVDLGAERAKRG
jgi:hypothetical protein